MGKLLQAFIGKGPDLIDAFGSAIDKVSTTDEERGILENVKANMQVELNKIEAQHRSLFIAGWRPFIGWVCGIGLSFTFVVNPMIAWIFRVDGPQVPIESLMELVLGMLGLAGLRTYEKYKGKTK